MKKTAVALLLVLLISGCSRLAPTPYAPPADLDVTSEEFLNKLGHYGAFVDFLHSRSPGAGLMGEVDRWYAEQLSPQTGEIDYTKKYTMLLSEESAYGRLRATQEAAQSPPSFGAMDEQAGKIAREAEEILAILKALAEVVASEPIDDAAAQELASRLENGLLRMQPGVVEFSDNYDLLRERARTRRMEDYTAAGEPGAARILELDRQIASLMRRFDGIDAPALQALRALRESIPAAESSRDYGSYLGAVDAFLLELRGWEGSSFEEKGADAFLRLWECYEESVREFNRLRL